MADVGCQPGVEEAELRLLTPYAVEYRYDDEAPELLTRVQAVGIVSSVLDWANVQTGLDTP